MRLCLKALIGLLATTTTLPHVTLAQGWPGDISHTANSPYWYLFSFWKKGRNPLNYCTPHTGPETGGGYPSVRCGPNGGVPGAYYAPSGDQDTGSTGFFYPVSVGKGGAILQLVDLDEKGEVFEVYGGPDGTTSLGKTMAPVYGTGTSCDGIQDCIDNGASWGWFQLDPGSHRIWFDLIEAPPFADDEWRVAAFKLDGDVICTNDASPFASFTLVDAATDEDIGPLPHSVELLDKYRGGLNIRADVSRCNGPLKHVDSVEFRFQGNEQLDNENHCESYLPYAAFGYVFLPLFFRDVSEYSLTVLES